MIVMIDFLLSFYSIKNNYILYKDLETILSKSQTIDINYKNEIN